MNVKRILLTGDDGYNSIGTRLLVYFLKDRYELAIAATKKQQSGVGGHLSVTNGGKWGETSVDGVRALWVDGYPADAVECSIGYFEKPFDLVISGINLGANIGGAIFSSGTFSAAHRAINLGLAPRALVMSWNSHHSLYFKEHDGLEDMASYVDYPGSAAYEIFKLAQTNDFWGATIVNVNFPMDKSRKVRFTKPLPDLKSFYKYPIHMDRKKHTFSFPKEDLSKRVSRNIDLDSGAMTSGYIAISLYKNDLVQEDIYKKLTSREVSI